MLEGRASHRVPKYVRDGGAGEVTTRPEIEQWPRKPTAVKWLRMLKPRWTFVGEPAFSKHVQQFHRALTEPYSQLGGKQLYDPAEMEAFCDQYAPGRFGQLNKSIVNDEKKSPPKSTWKFKRQELCQCYIISVSFAIRYKSHIYVLFVPMENSNAVVIFSCFNLFYHWKRSTPPSCWRVKLTAPVTKYLNLLRQ